jgi:hypothetical protein
MIGRRTGSVHSTMAYTPFNFSTLTYNHHITNTSIILNIYGTMMKQGFKLVDNMEQEFWLGEDLMQFTTPSQNLENG